MMSILKLKRPFLLQVNKNPQAIAVQLENRSVTYKELDEKVNKWSRSLQSQGVECGQVLAICAKSSLEQIIILDVHYSCDHWMPLRILNKGIPNVWIYFDFGVFHIIFSLIVDISIQFYHFVCRYCVIPN